MTETECPSHQWQVYYKDGSIDKILCNFCGIDKERYLYLSNIDISGGHGSIPGALGGLSYKIQLEKEAQAHIQTAVTLQVIIEKLESRIIKLRAGLNKIANNSVPGGHDQNIAKQSLKEDDEVQSGITTSSESST